MQKIFEKIQTTVLSLLHQLGERVEVFWPDDNTYYPGVVTEVTHGGQHVVLYDDSDVETLNFSNEVWRYESIPHAHA